MKKVQFFMSILAVVLMCRLMHSCTDVDISMPKGPKGDKGDRGLSAYEFWKEKVIDGTIEWPKDETSETDYFKFLKGKDGKDGKSVYELWKEYISSGTVPDPHNPSSVWNPSNNTLQHFYQYLTGATGENGQTPHIGNNGNWWIGNVDTGKPAIGKDGKPGEPGKDAVPPVITIGANGNWFIDGVDTGKPSKGEDGKDGKTPVVTIGDNGNWFINGKDTGKPAVGKDGKSPEVAIGNNGNWFINGKDTGKPAYGKEGKQGADGQNGRSAYELWKEEVATGKLEDPHNPGHYWNTSNNTLNHFWQFLRGPKGSDGIDGKDGEPGVTILVGAYNVLPVFYNGKLREYVNPADGSVIFRVYKPSGEVAGAGVKVKGLPGCVDPNREYTTDADGKFVVPRDQLPENRSLPERTGKTTVIEGGTTYESVPNTTTPNRIHTRIVMKDAKLYGYSGLSVSYRAYWTTIVFEREREVDGTWGTYPLGLATTKVKVAKIQNHTATLDMSNLEFNTHWQQNNYIFEDSARVIRPSVFTNYEDDYASTGDKKFKWDNVDKYFTVVGETNFYGEEPIMPAAILVPEINGCAPLKDVKMYIEQGSTNLWGEIDTDKFSYYFDTRYPVPSTSNPTVSNPAVWKPTRREASELPANFEIRVQVTAYQSGSQITTFQIRTKAENKFLLKGAYPQENGATQVFTYPSKVVGSFRAMKHYTYVIKNASSGTPSYWLREPFNHAGVGEINVPMETAPATWGQ